MKLSVVLIALLTLITRIWSVDQVPPHLSNDEISIAYDAYSLAFSGKDEHGKTRPLAFESHGTYKAPLYAYVLVPLERIWGNNEVVARLPSIIAGIITVWLVGLIALKLTGNSWIGLMASGVLAVTPAHIMTSRMVLEANLALMFLAIGIYLVLDKKWIWGIISLVISMYAYHTEWLFVPMLVLITGKIFIKKNVFYLAMIGLMIVLVSPLAVDYLKNSGAGARAKSEVIWREARLEEELKNVNYLAGGLKIAKVFFQNYLGYFNPGYLFFNGLNLLPKDNPFQPGVFLWPLIVPMIIGLTKLKMVIKKDKLIFFISWIILSPVVASLTHGGPNLLRNLNSLLPLSIVISVGLVSMLKTGKLIIGSVTIISLIMFLIIYYEIYPIEMAESFQGYKPIAQYLKEIESRSKKVYIDYRYGNYATGRGQEYIGVPHLYFGFYNRWDPSIIQNRIDEKDGVHFDKYVVGQVDWNNIEINNNYYYVVAIGNTPSKEKIEKLSLVMVFNDASGKKAFELWKGR